MRPGGYGDVFESRLGLVLLTLSVLAPQVASAQFSPSDLAGTWSLYIRFDDPAGNNPGWTRASISLDQAGNVTGGSATAIDGSMEAITGGALSVSPTGKVAGTLITDTGTGPDEFADFQLDLAGDLLVGTDTDADGGVAMSTTVRRSGLFSSADLAGNWYLYTHWDDRIVGNLPGWTRARVTVDSNGTVTASPLVQDSDGGSDPLVGLDFDIAPTGAVTISVPAALTDSELQMTPDKQSLFGVVNDTEGGGSVANLLVAVKVSSGATTADLEGTWYNYSFFDRTGANGPRWTRSVFTVDASGSVTGGSKSDSSGGSSSLTSGTLSVDGNGLVGGTLTFGALTSDRFVDAMLNPARDLFAGVASGTGGADDRRIISVAVAVPEAGGTGALLGLLAGLAVLHARPVAVRRLSALPGTVEKFEQ